MNSSEADKTLVERANKLLKMTRAARDAHRHGEDCMQKGPECPTCHFWSGSIATLNELLGNSGVTK